MLSKKILLLLLALSVIGNSFTLYILFNFKKKTSIIFANQEFALKNSEELLITTKENFHQSLLWQLKYEGYSVNQSTKLITPDDLNYQLKNWIGSEIKLIYRITDKSCDVCFDKITEKLKGASNLIGWDNIVVILPIKELRKTIAAFKEQQINARIFAVNEELALGIPLETSSSPFFFIINKELTVKNLFIPHKNGAELTEAYLAEMSYKYFTEND
ncbi:MAG: hypothetical protein KF845_01170 [Cyclobacteriaceae bacterium]|nr:hypothetical protein [Cyclobacteriaceae bacterium]